jgi:hypothetical protein
MVNNTLKGLFVEETVGSAGLKILVLPQNFPDVFMIFSVRIFAHAVGIGCCNLGH